MSKINRIVFWEPCVSPHKSDFFDQLSKTATEIEIICCANIDLPAERKSQGWSIESSNSYQTIISENQNEIDKLVQKQINSTLHVFSGIRWVPNIVIGLKSVRKYKAKFAIMSEPRVAEGWKGKFRFAQSWLTEHWLRRNVEFVLGQGRNGPPWFKSVGYTSSHIFPFAYFVNPPIQELPIDSMRDTSKIKIGYVGRLIKEKGIYDLVSAVDMLDNNTTELRIVGTGVEDKNLKISCDNLHIDASFLGVLPNNKIGEFFQHIDVLVLVSTTSDDGWGVVVSEALMSGTAVIATKYVGASIVLDNAIFGKFVPTKSPKSIALAIKELNREDAFTTKTRDQRSKMAKLCLSAERGSRHFIDIMQWKFEGKSKPEPFYKLKSIK